MIQDTCEIYCYDEAKVTRLKKSLATQPTRDIAYIFKALSDDTRVKIIYALCQEDELCVCDAANIVGSTVANASHHLRSLKNMGLATYRKEGKLVFYSLVDVHIKQFIHIAFELNQEGKQYE